MPAIKVPTNFNIDLEFEIPEFYRRLIALLIDFVILFLYTKVADEIMKSLMIKMIRDEDALETLYWTHLAVRYIPVVMYFILTEALMNGQTVGKKIMGIRVVNENGGKASLSQFMIRWLIRDIWFIAVLSMSFYQEERGNNFQSSLLVMIVLAYFITDIVLVVSSKKGQRIADILAKTILIRTDTKGDIEDTVFREVADSYVPQYPQIMQLSDKDINAIKSILETSRRKGDFYMAEAASNKIKVHLKIESNLDPYEFLDVLLKDYNYLSTRS